MVDKIAVTSRREVVAVIEEATTAQRCLTVALRAAQRVNSPSLSALHICVDPAKLVAAVEEISLQSMREIEEGPTKTGFGVRAQHSKDGRRCPEPRFDGLNTSAVSHPP